jgi:hypothetical protein
MKFRNDNLDQWESEAAYMPMAGLADDTSTAPAPATSTSWLQAVGADIAQIISATKQPAAPATTTSTAASTATSKTLLYIGVGLAGLFALTMMMKKR